MLYSLKETMQTFIFGIFLNLIIVIQNQPNRNSISDGEGDQFGKRIESTVLLNESQQAKGKDAKI